MSTTPSHALGNGEETPPFSQALKHNLDRIVSTKIARASKGITGDKKSKMPSLAKVHPLLGFIQEHWQILGKFLLPPIALLTTFILIFGKLALLMFLFGALTVIAVELLLIYLYFSAEKPSKSFQKHTENTTG